LPRRPARFDDALHAVSRSSARQGVHIDYERLSHSVWDCRYLVVFIPKYRKKTLYGELRRRLGDVLRTLAKQKE
jgi:Transposase IS200 like